MGIVRKHKHDDPAYVTIANAVVEYEIPKERILNWIKDGKLNVSVINGVSGGKSFFLERNQLDYLIDPNIHIMIPNGMYTTKQSLKALGIGPMTLFRWVRSGVIKKRKVGWHTFYSIAEVENINKKKAEPIPPDLIVGAENIRKALGCSSKYEQYKKRGLNVMYGRFDAKRKAYISQSDLAEFKAMIENEKYVSNDEWLTIRDACKELKMKGKTLYYHIARGNIPIKRDSPNRTYVSKQYVTEHATLYSVEDLAAIFDMTVERLQLGLSQWSIRKKLSQKRVRRTGGFRYVSSIVADLHPILMRKNLKKPKMPKRKHRRHKMSKASLDAIRKINAEKKALKEAELAKEKVNG